VPARKGRSNLAQVEKGRRFYITKHGRRIAEVKPVEVGRPKPRFGSGRRLVGRMAADFDAYGVRRLW